MEERGQKNQIENKIPFPEAYLLTAFAIIADLINWIPIINIFISVITLGFTLYFIIKGVPFLLALAGTIAEFFPVLSVFPILTVAIVITIALHWLPVALQAIGLKIIAKPVAKATEMLSMIQAPKNPKTSGQVSDKKPMIQNSI